MKIKKLLLCSALLLTACGTAQQASSSEEINVSETIELMRKASYNVTFTGEVKLTYPEAYSNYNSTNPVSFTRDYGFSDGKKAVRIYDDDDTLTYFREDSGKIYSEYITIDNTVAINYKQTLGKFYQFDELFTQPFDYLTKRDFTESTLQSDKAYFVFKSFSEYTQPVKSAKFSYLKNGLVDKIDFEFLPYPIGFQVSEEQVETIIQEMTGSFKFTYNLNAFEHLKPFEEECELYKKATTNLGNNYTLTIDSNALSSQMVTYVTEDSVYIHTDSNAYTPVSDDMYYIKRGSGYRVYAYNGSSWAREENITDINSVLVRPDLVDNRVVEKVGSSHLKVKESATPYAGEKFVLPYLGITSGTSLKTDIYVKNDRFDYITSSFYYYSGNIVIKSIFSDYGTTSLPNWFEAPTF